MRALPLEFSSMIRAWASVPASTFRDTHRRTGQKPVSTAVMLAGAALVYCRDSGMRAGVTRPDAIHAADSLYRAGELHVLRPEIR